MTSHPVRGYDRGPRLRTVRLTEAQIRAVLSAVDGRDTELEHAPGARAASQRATLDRASTALRGALPVPQARSRGNH